MLLRMYQRWAESRQFKWSIMEQSDGEEAGIESATPEIDGRYASWVPICREGTHRLVPARRRSTLRGCDRLVGSLNNGQEDAALILLVIISWMSQLACRLVVKWYTYTLRGVHRRFKCVSRDWVQRRA